MADKWQEGLKPYWVNTSSNDLIRQIISRSGASAKQDLELLIRGECIEKVIDDNVVFGEIENSADTLWSFLLMSGYLTIRKKTLIEGVMHGELLIPNQEVYYLFRQIILGWFNQSIYSDKYRMMLNALINGDLETFEAVFREFVFKSFSYFDVAEKEAERVYHAFVLGLLLGLSDTHEVKSNRKSGYGRYDVMVIPKDPAQSGIVIEFKTVRKNETLEEAAEAALQQIAKKS